MNNYTVEYQKQAVKQLQKMDPYASKKIYTWISKNLVNCCNPYFQGKQLKGNLSKYWRYRVGNYRILAEIDNEQIKIIIISAGDRKEIYE